MWARLSDEQRRVYGKEYFEHAIRSLEKYTKVVSFLVQVLKQTPEPIAHEDVTLI